MAKQFCIHIRLSNYLRQWFLHLYKGKEPVELLRGCPERDIIHRHLAKVPVEGMEATDETVAICFPTFVGVNRKVWHFITPRGYDALRAVIKADFDMHLWKDIHSVDGKGVLLMDKIMDWMEDNGIEVTDTNYETVYKIYQRKRAIYYKRKRRNGKGSEKS